MSKTSIKNPSIGIRPSPKLIEFIKTLDDPAVDLPENLLKVYQAFSQDTRPRNVYKSQQQQQPDESMGVYSEEEKQLLVSLSDDTFQGSTDLEKCMKSLSVRIINGGDDDDSHNSDVETLAPDERISKNKARQIRAKQRQKELAKLTLNMADLKWLHCHLNDARQKNAMATNDATAEVSTTVPYLHELVEGSELILPANEVVERNPELEARCQRLKLEQDEYKYRQMTKNVDCARTYEPEETISYQVKQMNRQLIAVAQFIFSVAAGFAFGFIGIELLVGNLDFGFRLLLGVIFALIIALAEIYFLAKKLNEEIDEVEQLQQKLFSNVQLNPNASTTTNTSGTTNTKTGASASTTASKAQNQKEHNE